MAASKTGRAMSLGSESFGDKLHRAYRQGRAKHGFTYLKVAEKISQLYPVSDQSILRLEMSDEIPAQARQRIVAYFAILAYGFDPADFGLTPENVPLGAFDMKKVRECLIPRSGCSSRSVSGYATGSSRVSPGHSIGVASSGSRSRSRAA